MTLEELIKVKIVLDALDAFVGVQDVPVETMFDMDALRRAADDPRLFVSSSNPNGLWVNLVTGRRSVAMGVVKDDDSTITWDAVAMQDGR